MRLFATIRVALRALLVHKGRSFLTSLGIIIGIGAVIASLAGIFSVFFNLQISPSSIDINRRSTASRRLSSEESVLVSWETDRTASST